MITAHRQGLKHGVAENRRHMKHSSSGPYIGVSQRALCTIGEHGTRSHTRALYTLFNASKTCLRHYDRSLTLWA